MKKWIVILSVVTVLTITPQAMARDFNDGGTFTIDNTYHDSGTGVRLDFNTINTPGTHLDLIGGNIFSFIAFNNSTMTMTGGSIALDLLASDNSIVTVSGGDIGHIIVAFYNSTIYLDGTNFQIDDQTLSYGDKLSDFVPLVISSDGTRDLFKGNITGTLADGTALDNKFYIHNKGIYEGNGDIIIIPEPCSLALLSLGGLLLRRRKA